MTEKDVLIKKAKTKYNMKYVREKCQCSHYFWEKYLGGGKLPPHKEQYITDMLTKLTNGIK